VVHRCTFFTTSLFQYAYSTSHSFSISGRARHYKVKLNELRQHLILNPLYGSYHQYYKSFDNPLSNKYRINNTIKYNTSVREPKKRNTRPAPCALRSGPPPQYPSLSGRPALYNFSFDNLGQLLVQIRQTCVPDLIIRVPGSGAWKIGCKSMQFVSCLYLSWACPYTSILSIPQVVPLFCLLPSNILEPHRPNHIVVRKTRTWVTPISLSLSLSFFLSLSLYIYIYSHRIYIFGAASIQRYLMFVETCQ